eukprot:jgi/Ulvmu1/10931/UM007_0110.1
MQTIRTGTKAFQPVLARRQAPAARRCNCEAAMQFIKGIDEPCVPNINLTRSRDGSNGVATFVFDGPSVFEADNALGEITGLYMVDEEGEMASVDVNAKFVNGKPSQIECKYVMRSSMEWDRFMRFMERYAEENELGFKGKN